MITICHLKVLHMKTFALHSPVQKKAKALPFTLTGRHVQNVEVMFQGEEYKVRRQLEKSNPIREPWPPLFWDETVKPI